MKIAIASDHAGFTLAAELKTYLSDNGYQCVDFGANKLDPKDDYPDFVIPAAKAVASGECERGVVIGGDGQGEAMAANRVNGIRCGVYYGPSVPIGIVEISGRTSHNPYEMIKLIRQHNNANMLSLAARFLSLPDAKNAVKLWLDTDFTDEPRHVRRLAKLDKRS